MSYVVEKVYAILVCNVEGRNDDIYIFYYEMLYALQKVSMMYV